MIGFTRRPLRTETDRGLGRQWAQRPLLALQKMNAETSSCGVGGEDTTAILGLGR